MVNDVLLCPSPLPPPKNKKKPTQPNMQPMIPLPPPSHFPSHFPMIHKTVCGWDEKKKQLSLPELQ